MIRIFDLSQKEEALRILSQRNTGDLGAIDQAVKGILSDIREKGDEALFMYTRTFDCFVTDKDSIEVKPAEMKAAYKAVDPKLVSVVKEAAKNIRQFHEKQVRKTWVSSKDGKTLGQVFNPIQKCGVYVPGGKAAYPSSVLMNIIPAKVAGVTEIIMATPPNDKGQVAPLILVAADIAGVSRIFKVGGAQAIGAMAYGTETIPAVYKITGPGNAYVASAKKQVFGTVGIDMIAGPSEVMVLDDGSIDVRFIAADVLSQAEHDEMAACIAVVPNTARAEALNAEIFKQVETLPKKEIASQSLRNYGMIMVVDRLADQIAFANEVAPEHLELCIKNPEGALPRIKNAGAIFLGAYSPEPLGDYFAGPNHVLPTNGTAKFSSSLSVDDFIKKSNVIGYSQKALKSCYTDIVDLAEYEGLAAHAKSLIVRFEEEK